MDINCDVGEGVYNEEAIMAYIDSCNIACGGHTGDEKSMTETLRLAKKYGVRAGAHPSFEDRPNFGRRVMKMPLELLRSQLISQVSSLKEIANREGMKLHHIKAHGALYNEAARSEDVARILFEVAEHFRNDLCIFVPCGSIMEREADRLGVTYWREAFADRNYDEDLNLLPRSDPKAVILDPEEIRLRVLNMARENQVVAQGIKKPIKFDTICVHGDHPKALEIVKILHDIKKGDR